MKNLQIVWLIVVIYLLEISNQLPNHNLDRQKRNTGRSLFFNKDNDGLADKNVSRTLESRNTENLPKIIPGNHLVIGDCSRTDHELLYYDDTAIENSGPSTLNGTFEIYIDGPVEITCVKCIDQVMDGSGLIALNSGGVGHNWIFIDVAGKYGRGFHWLINIYGFDKK